MDTLDEKANGAPPMEVEEIVSVNDRESHTCCGPSCSFNSHLFPAPDEAFAAKHMPDLGHDVKEFKVYTWKLASWKKLEKKITSPEFECGGHRWYAQRMVRINLFSSWLWRVGVSCSSLSATPTRLQTIPCPCIWIMPTLNVLPKDGMHVPSSHWLSQIHMTPRFTLSAVRTAVLSSRYDIYTFELDAHHRFIAEECDWGFTRFSELRKLFSIQDGHTRPTIEDDAADVSVFVRVLEDPTGVLWHNFVK